MELNYFAIFTASVAQFIFGAVWYGALFGRLWGKMHGFEKLSKDTQQQMMKGMGLLYLTQFIVTILTTFILAIFITYVPDWNAYALAGFLWLGFVLPTQISSVIFGGTPPEWVVKKIAVQSSASLACLEIAAIILNLL